MEQLKKAIALLESLQGTCQEWTLDRDHRIHYLACPECGSEPGHDQHGEECQTCVLYNNLYSVLDHLNCHEGWLRYHRGIR